MGPIVPGQLRLVRFLRKLRDFIALKTTAKHVQHIFKYILSCLQGISGVEVEHSALLVF